MSQELTWLSSKWIAAFNWWRVVHFEVQCYLLEVLEHLLLFVALYLLTCFVLYLLIMRWRVLSFRRDIQSASRVLLVIAHPDDESMFFGPTVLNFTERKNCTLYLMCLSTGQNYGMGKTRKRELYEACKTLGIKEECIIVQTHTNMPDSMSVKWPTEIVANSILHQVETYDIDTLITFDKHGISKHLNHCSIYYAVAHLSTSKLLPNTCSVYVLETVNLIRKYWLVLDIPICFILSRIRFILDSPRKKTVYNAMRQHKSQFVWFRRLYLMFSRYQLVNTLQKMDATDIELDLGVDD